MRRRERKEGQQQSLILYNQLKAETSKGLALEKTLDSNQKELEKVTSKIQTLESKISKEMHDKTTLQADKASLVAELKDEQIKASTLAREVIQKEKREKK